MSDGKDCTRGFRSISASKDSTQSPCVVWNQFLGRKISLCIAFFFSHSIRAVVDIFLFVWNNFFFQGRNWRSKSNRERCGGSWGNCVGRVSQTWIYSSFPGKHILIYIWTDKYFHKQKRQNKLLYPICRLWVNVRGKPGNFFKVKIMIRLEF